MALNKRFSQLIIIGLVFTLFSCNSGAKLPTLTPAAPTEEFTGKNSFGDGFIAHVPINDVKHMGQEEIVRLLVAQWLEHYKSENIEPTMLVKDYKIDKIVLVEKTADNPTITAGVQISVIPAEVPSNTSEIPKTIWYGSALSGIKGNWWTLDLMFNVYEKHEVYYWLRIVSYGG